MKFTDGWLNYKKISEQKKEALGIYREQTQETPVTANALLELREGIRGLYQRDIVEKKKEEAGLLFIQGADMQPESCRIRAEGGICTLTYADESGLLYAVFALLRHLQKKQTAVFEELVCDLRVTPDNPLRMLNHWDNMDGSIERGYAGNSFFFAQKQLIIDERTLYYARLAASVGINGVVINNVNVDDTATKLITDEYYERVGQLAEIFASYGIRLFLSINYASPMVIGKLETADPLAQEVKDWWRAKAKEAFEKIPSLGGFLVKADSEGREGPFTYGRTHADGANMLAEAVLPYGGIIIWRCFVYNCRQDWRDNTVDRARAGYDHFKPLDGKFMDNVILQIKNGPMDFQVREPVSPLFGGLTHTNMMLEFQIAQEYTGQQKHVCYLLPWFCQVLHFDMHCEKQPSRVRDIISGRTYGQRFCGIAAVANTGNDENWTGHDLAAANLYGYGRLAFDLSLTPEEIAEEWLIQTFGAKEKLLETLKEILMTSWQTYENYTAPLGIGWMVNPNNHFGPNVDGYEYDRWGTYHKSNCRGMGMDRTSKGTGYCSQYHEPLRSLYENVETCPDELLLFFHHLPYTHRLKSGKTIIQHIYDTHFEGAQMAGTYVEKIKECQSDLEEETYQRLLERFVFQREHALEWRDRINTYYHRMSGIEDEKGREIYE